MVGRIAFGPRAGLRVQRYGSLGPGYTVDVTGPRCAQTGGFNLHANTAVAANRSEELEKLCRYVARPPISNDRVLYSQDGKVYYRLKKPYSDATTHVVFTPLEFVEKVAALVAPPRMNLTRYHGIVAPHAKNRKAVIPRQDPVEEKRQSNTPCGRKNYTWAVLMRRVFGLDLEKCSECGGRLRPIAAITQPDVIRRFLRSIGLPADSPGISPPRAPPEAEMAFICPP